MPLVKCTDQTLSAPIGLESRKDSADLFNEMAPHLVRIAFKLIACWWGLASFAKKCEDLFDVNRAQKLVAFCPLTSWGWFPVAKKIPKQEICYLFLRWIISWKSKENVPKLGLSGDSNLTAATVGNTCTKCAGCSCTNEVQDFSSLTNGLLQNGEIATSVTGATFPVRSRVKYVS